MKHSCGVLLALVACSALAAGPNGEQLFHDNCSVCHGERGMGGSAPKLVGDASEWKPKLFERAVLKGIDDAGKPLKTPMPHWQLASFKTDNGRQPSKAEVDAIQHYLHEQK
ncbi:c-type cytochrome [Pseudomonas panipatensis]|uniref:Cytochrome C oxidase, cbb3-type, subunit III n=1 Tax=Pseudomonas panipatensis TaxID=428992 RepID=A0A1G8KZV9_9PSED|nr:cytochrome c [Pseudomonas panipatensis]SDI48913.1 Cytochrome C oxidase, cbb3-type, subunit III [Pseudomonas panipatensis]SMP72924.1 Cytochrome C oxidase, cbb3-type, subunit III [Pseudomonas panipatensis]